MVNIVIVSHSSQLAEATAELAQEVAQGRCLIACAGGMDDPEHPTGTDPVKIMETIKAVYTQSGVLVLMDLGSALISTETAIDLLTPDYNTANIHLSAAPLVEGAIAAAVAAAAGLSLDEVIQEALAALAPKIAQLIPESLARHQPPSPPKESKYEILWVLRNPNGLHIRSAARLVNTLTGFNTKATLIKGQYSANARSITSLSKLGARYGDTVKLIVHGPEAEQAATAFYQLASQYFVESHSE